MYSAHLATVHTKQHLSIKFMNGRHNKNKKFVLLLLKHKPFLMTVRTQN